MPAKEINTPRISIIIVTYNAAADLQNCLESIYRQKYPFIEIIIMDGGSTDGTIHILETNNDQIAFWTSEKDNGIYDAMNKALDHINYEWVYFIGADDELLEDFSTMAHDLKDPSVIYYGSVNKNGEKYRGYIDAYQHAKTTICHQAVFYPASVFKKYRFDTRFRISADHVFNMWCWKDKNYRFEFLDYIIAVFSHEGISSTQKDLVFEKQKAALIKENYGTKIWLRYIFKQFKKFFKSNK